MPEKDNDRMDPLEPVIENLANVPEPLRAAYQQVTDEKHPAGKGKYVLNVKPSAGFSLEHTDSLRNALGSERQRAKQLEADLKRFEGIKDPAAALEALGSIDRLKDAIPKGQFDELVAKHVNGVKGEYDGKLTAKQKELQDAQDIIRELAINQAATNAILSAGGDQETVDLLLPKVLELAHVEQVQGQRLPVVRLRGKDGVALVTKRPNQNGPMDLGELITEVLKPKYKGVWPSGVRKGGGANGADGAGNPPPQAGQKLVIARSEMNNRMNEIRVAMQAAAKAGRPITDFVEIVD